MIYFVFVLIAVLAFVEWWSLRQIPVLDVDLRPDSGVVSPDQAFNVVIRIENRGRKRASFLKYELQFTSDFELPGDSRLIEGSLSLRPHEMREIVVSVKAKKRGRYVLRPVKIYRGDFLGISEELMDFDQYVEVICAPKLPEDREYPEIVGGLLGNHSVRRFIHEDPVLIAGYHDYTGKEPMRSISWTQTAKRGELMVRQYDHTSEENAMVFLCSNDESGETFETLCSLALGLCAYLEDRGVSYSLVLNTALAGGFDEKVLNGLGAHHYTKVMEMLGRALKEENRNFVLPMGDHFNETLILVAQNDMKLDREHLFLGGSR